jgi:hypothetical protein
VAPTDKGGGGAGGFLPLLKPSCRPAGPLII